MDYNANEELRNLLRSADKSRDPSLREPERDLAELASLIGSLDADFKDVARARPAGGRGDVDARSAIESMGQHSTTTSLAHRWKDGPMDEDSVRSDMSISRAVVDVPDFSVVCYGAACVLRGKLGRYLTARAEEGGGSAAGGVPATYTLGVHGQGVGSLLDCISFMNIENKEDTGPVRYGAVVALRALGAKERLMGLREGGRLGFWRNLLGQGEKWVVLKAAQTSLGGAGGLGAAGLGLGLGGSRGCEEGGSRGKYLRRGDALLLQTLKTDHLLSLHETVRGAEPRLVPRDRAGLGAEAWQVEQFGAVPPPAWLLRRPYLCGRYLVLPSAAKNPAADIQARAFPQASAEAREGPAAPPPLASLSPAAQQQALMRDLLQVLAGFEGQYMRAAASASVASEVTFLIDMEGAERALANQAAQLLPVCESAVRVREFVRLHSRYEYGLCSHALCAALKRIVREFDVLVAQLEAVFAGGALSLQKMTYLLQPSRVTLLLLEKICARLKDKVGGQMIDSLHACLLEQGDARARELHLHLLSKASAPFLAILSTWISRGDLEDPYGEFMVREDRALTKQALEEDFNARYWDNRYTLCAQHVPAVLRPYAEKALTAGKYLSVLRDCAGEALPEQRQLAFSLEVADSPVSQAIEEAYVMSSRALLRILDSGGLRQHLRSLRRFFLLEHGDFFTQFMDSAEEELRRDVKDVALARVQGLLQTAVQTSTLHSDPHREELSCSLASHNLIQHLNLIQSAGEGGAEAAYATLASQGLKGIEAFTLDYRVGWPHSLVLSRRAITKYQLLSRLLYFSKHVERRLLIGWMGHQSTKELNVRGAMGPIYCLRHRMLHFLQNFVYYMTLEVIGPRGHELEQLLDSAEDLDEVLDLHEKFLDTCLKECLLASQDLLQILTKLMTTCLLFADQMQRHAAENLEPALRNIGAKQLTSSLQLRQSRLKENEQHIHRETSHASFPKLLAQFSDTFDSQLRDFLDKLWTNHYRHHVQLSNLCVRLDYNGFYSSQFAENI